MIFLSGHGSVEGVPAFSQPQVPVDSTRHRLTPILSQPFPTLIPSVYILQFVPENTGAVFKGFIYHYEVSVSLDQNVLI